MNEKIRRLDEKEVKSLARKDELVSGYEITMDYYFKNGSSLTITGSTITDSSDLRGEIDIEYRGGAEGYEGFGAKIEISKDGSIRIKPYPEGFVGDGDFIYPLEVIPNGGEIILKPTGAMINSGHDGKTLIKEAPEIAVSQGGIRIGKEIFIPMSQLLGQ